MGPSAAPGICPENQRVGEFTGNSAHSVGRYGLRIFHNMFPRKFACSGYADWNPAVTANFTDFTGWKNGRNGAIAGTVGAVVFDNFKVIDNKEAGMEFEVMTMGLGNAYVDRSHVVGRSAGNGGGVSGPRGIISPRSDSFKVQNTKFYNFNFGSAACLGSCSHCSHMASTDSGARVVTFENLWFDEETVTKRIGYGFPNKAIFYDVDGSLTGLGDELGPGSWATPWANHHNVSECQ